MEIRRHPPAHLTYCMNVHPGTSLADQVEAVKSHAVPIRDGVAPGCRFGLGLRLSARASLELEDASRLMDFRSKLDAANLYAFTVNGFPYGSFHGTAVKEQVYAPDWRTEERQAYTIRLARHLAALVPDGVSGSISTVPGSYKPWIRSEADVTTMAERLVDTAVALAAVRAETGTEIHLGLEPEPDCFLETTDEAIAFFEGKLLPVARARCGASEETLRRHVGICLDTCHLSLQFEDLVESLGRIVAAGIRVSKIQISAALRTTFTQASSTGLRRFCDPVYLHQVKARAGGSVLSRGDLEQALGGAEGREGEEWRVHFHVPLYWVGEGALGTTANEISPAFLQRALELGVEHFEIETYTFDVLPPELRSLGVNRSIADEYRWVLQRLPHG